MASRVNTERLMEKKEKAIEKVMDKKERSIEFSNSLNNAVLIWTTLANNPKIDVNGALEEIRDIQQVLLSFKGEPEPARTTTVEEARIMVQDAFPGSQQVVTAPSEPPTRGGFAIKDPEAPASQAQIKMIHAVYGRLGVRDDATKIAQTEMRLGLGNLASLDKLTKGLASALIEKLVADEKARQ